MKSASCLVVLGVAILAAAPLAAQEAAPPTIAILEFETTPAGTVLPPPQMGATLADLLLDRLVNSGKFRVKDGRWLETDRTWRGPDGRQPGFDAVRASAEAAGVDYLVIGSVTRFSTENRQRSVGGAAFVIPLLGGVRRARTELAVNLMVRVVDVKTGDIVTTTTSAGASGRRQLNLGAVGLARLGGGGALSNRSSNYRDSLLAESMQEAVARAADAIVNAAPRLTGTSRTRS